MGSVFRQPAYANTLIGALLVGGTALAVGPASEATEARALAEHGAVAVATVDRSAVVKTGGTRSIVEDVTFQTAGGDAVHVRLKDCDRHAIDPPGTTVEVVYDPAQPTAHSATRLLHPACGPQFVRNATGFTIAAAILLGLATLWWGLRWRRRAWRWWGAALALALLGGTATAAAFSENCHCASMAWVAAPLAALGLVALVGRATTGRRSPPANAPAR